jgi:hypothetical protein
VSSKWDWPLKNVIALLLTSLPWTASAQTAVQSDSLQELLLKLRACVRANAPAMQAAGIKNVNEATNLLSGKCGPQSGLLIGPGKLSLDDFANVGPLPPGILRRAASEEWVSFIEETRAR